MSQGHWIPWKISQALLLVWGNAEHWTASGRAFFSAAEECIYVKIWMEAAALSTGVPKPGIVTWQGDALENFAKCRGKLSVAFQSSSQVAAVPTGCDEDTRGHVKSSPYYEMTQVWHLRTGSSTRMPEITGTSVWEVSSCWAKMQGLLDQ